MKKLRSQFPQKDSFETDKSMQKIHEIPTLGKTNRVSLKMVRSLIYRHPIAYFFGFFRHEVGLV